MIKAPVPDDDASCAVIALRDNALKILVIKRMVFNHDGQPFYGRIQRGPLRHGPALQHPFQLQPEIIMKGPGRVLMNDKNETVPLMANARFRFGRFLEFPFGCVFF